MPSPSRQPPQLTLLVLVVGLVLATAAASSDRLLVVALLACAGVIAWGWAGALALPSPRGTFGVLSLGGAALVLAVALRDGAPWLGWLPAALALSMISAFAHQLLRRDGRPRVVESVSAVVLGLVLIGTGVLLIPSSRTDLGVTLVLAALAAAAASALTDQLGRVPPLRAWLTPAWLTPVALLAGAGAGAGVALLAGAQVEVWVFVGVASAALSHAVRTVLAPLPTMGHPRPKLVVAVASMLVVGLVPYLVAIVLTHEALPG